MYTVTVKESIIDILLTPIGSRVCLPEYGSRIFELLDKPVDDTFKADLTRYAFEAIRKWEKRVKPVRIVELKNNNGSLSFKIELDDAKAVEVSFYA